MSIFKRPGSPFYYCEFIHRGHRLLRSTKTTTARDARLFERRLREQLAREVAAHTAVPAVTLDQACERYWQEHGRRLRWAAEVDRHLHLVTSLMDKCLPIAHVGPKEVTSFVEARRNQGAGPAGVNRSLAVLQGVMNRAAANWEMPVKAIAWKRHKLKEPKERVRFITLEEALRLITTLPTHAALIVRFLILTGLRKREVLDLTWDNVEFAQSLVRVKVKGGHTREVPIEGEALLVLHEAPRTGRLVFDATNFRRHWDRALATAGIADFRVHDLRHTFATWLRQGGVALEVIRKALGHSSVAVTQKYAHVVQVDVREALHKLPSLGTFSTRAEAGIGGQT